MKDKEFSQVFRENGYPESKLHEIKKIDLLVNALHCQDEIKGEDEIDVINKAKEIKKNGGVGALNVELSNSIEDTLNRTNKESKGLLHKMSDDNILEFKLFGSIYSGDKEISLDDLTDVFIDMCEAQGWEFCGFTSGLE